MNIVPKVCLLTCLLDLTDSQSLLEAKAILSWGYPLTTICPGEVPPSLADCEIEHHPIPLPAHHFDYKNNLLNVLCGLVDRARNSLLAFYHLLKIKPDICVCIQPDSWVIALLGKLLLGNRVVVDLREIYEDRAAAFPSRIEPALRKLLRFVFWALSKYTDEIIHVSEARKEHYAYLQKPGIVISPFPQIEYFTKNRPLDHRAELTIVHAGRLRWSYASEQLVEAIPLVLEQAPNVKFVVIGGVTPPLSNMPLIEQLNKEGKLVLIPQIPYEQVIDILLESDIGLSLVLPFDQTHMLAMPRKYFEYLAAGLPVVAANVPTLQQFTETIHCGVLVDPCSPQSIAQGILQLVASENLRYELGKKGRTNSEAQYNWENESKKLHHLLMDLATN